MIEQYKKLQNILKGENSSITSLEEILYGENIEDDFIVRGDGNVSACFALSFPDSESKTVKQIGDSQLELEKILRSLPVGTTAHFQWPNFNDEKSLMATTELNSPGFLTRRTIDYLGGRPVLKQQAFLYLCFNFTNEKTRNPFNTSFADVDRIIKTVLLKNPYGEVDKHKRKATSAIGTFLEQFKTIPDFKIKRLNDKEIAYARLRYFNLSFDRNPSTIEGNFNNTGKEITVGHKIVRFVSLQSTGTAVYHTRKNDRDVSSFMAWPLGAYMGCEHIVNVSMTIIDTEEELKKIDRYQKIRRGLIADKQRNASIADDLEEFTSIVRKENRALVHFNHNVMTWADNTDDLNFNVDRIVTCYQLMNGSIPMRESFNAGNLYFASAPGNAIEMAKPMTLALNHAILHLDLSKPTMSDQRGIVLANRDRVPVLMDLWPDESILPNKNRIVIGPTGSGKSFTMNTILSQEIESGIEVIIIDVGGSYKTLFEIFNGKYYDLSADTPLSFNPFLVPKDSNGAWVFNDYKKTFLIALIEILWKQQKSYLSNEESAVTLDLLSRYYNKLNSIQGSPVPRLDRFLDFVTELADRTAVTKEKKLQSGDKLTQEDGLFDFFNVNSFSRVLKEFTTGDFRHVLNSEANDAISFEQLVAFDLNGVKDNKILYPVMGLIIMNLILDKLNDPQRRGVKKEIVIDEGWSMLTGSMADFINMLFRTIRKQGGAVTIVTQTIIEFESEHIKHIGEAIKANAATVIILDHKKNPGQLPGIQRFFGFSKQQMDVIRSLRSSESEGREVFIKRGELYQVFWVDVGPHNMVAYSTSPDVVAKMQEYKKEAGTEYAINQIVEEKYRGI